MNYTITKKKIKNFIIRIYPDKSIKISVPYTATKKQIEDFIYNKKKWVEKTLEKIKDKEKDLSKSNIRILGKLREIRIIKSEMDMIRLSEKSIYIYNKNKNLSESMIKNILEEWKLNKLNEILKKYLIKYLPLLNAEINLYKIKKMSSAWGIYYTRQKSITFNSLLIEKDEECIDYVVLHELCHIFYQNHQKEFWNLVEKFMPEYKQFRRKLKE